jgi:predicted CoA-substrate-specific enzyme activase
MTPTAKEQIPGNSATTPDRRNGRSFPRTPASGESTTKGNADGGTSAGTPRRFLGIDVGAETVKVVELIESDGRRQFGRRHRRAHHKNPGAVLTRILEEYDWQDLSGAMVTGRLSRLVHLPGVPVKQAQARGWQVRSGGRPATIISIGAHGFSVLELHPEGVDVYRENGRCSQGTGNFLGQLVERFGLGVEEASELCADAPAPATLSGRCPVILKTDMTHLANKGGDRAGILAGLFDAVCANVLVLVKPGRCPEEIVLAGGVSQSRRVRHTFRHRITEMGLRLHDSLGEEALFLEASGTALLAADRGPGEVLPELAQLVRGKSDLQLERLPPLSAAMARVRRLKPPAPVRDAVGGPLIAGFDIGSTGSKLVILDAASATPVWEGYRRTSGSPVAAAQALWREYHERKPSGDGNRVTHFGVTGSGREIVGSLLTTCHGGDRVFVLNEIVAHATGALHHDPRVDTIFEIGGQDAKYIRLEDGRVIDAAMNEACSAGTGSFIEEQGARFEGIQDVRELAEAAVAAPSGVSLGQHCSVFMAEVIGEAVAAGIEQPAIIAGLYDSIIQNYLNRVKGSRSVGQVVFCQGMPFASDALAAAVARQTGSEVIVPPNPGTVGALGIALLTRQELGTTGLPAIDPAVFLQARVEEKDTFQCRSTKGCGEPGNLCRIDRLKTIVDGRRQTFLWGGGCSLYDQGTHRRKLPDRAPDPFREREALIQQLVHEPATGRGLRVALSDEFMLKGLAPFFITFLRGLGCRLVFGPPPDQATLRRGIQAANVPFCAPMQLFQGIVGELAGLEADALFLPMITSLPRTGKEAVAKTCPIVQAGPQMAWSCLSDDDRPRILSPVVAMDEQGLSGGAFKAACARLATELGAADDGWLAAFEAALAAQQGFEAACLRLGQAALDFCAENHLPAVAVLGRPYTIYNRVLNSNAPALLREQGAIGIPIDCLPLDESTPAFVDVFWAYSQRILRAAHQVRRLPGVYALYCSNYSCGPDSFTLHFAAYAMEGKPFAMLETDGHSGDAGTKTRIEAFLHCVHEDRTGNRQPAAPRHLRDLELQPATLEELRTDGRTLLLPRMGTASEPVAAGLRGMGIPAEVLPASDLAALRAGRRHTSGKECLPMSLTLGALLRRVEAEPNPKQNFTFLLPRPQGPCRFGAYNTLNQIVLDRLGLRDRVRLWSPKEYEYFDTFTPGATFLIICGFTAADWLLEALHEIRPASPDRDVVEAVHRRYEAELLQLVEDVTARAPSIAAVTWECATGRLFGIRDLLARAAAEFAPLRNGRQLPSVLLAGEIFVRLDPFSNGNVIRELEQRGIRVRLAPFHEWVDYVDHHGCQLGRGLALSDRFSRLLHRRLTQVTWNAIKPALTNDRLGSVAEAVEASEEYLRHDLEGEAVLTLGTPLHEWRRRRIDGMLSVGPLECMPNKIAEAQLHHVRQREGLLSLTLSLNGEPIDPTLLDNFAFEVHARFAERQGRASSARTGAAQTPHEQPACPDCATCGGAHRPA